MLVYHTHLKKFNVYSKVFVECIMCLCFIEAFSSCYSFWYAPLTLLVRSNIKKLKRTCIENSWHFGILGSQNPRSYGCIDFLA